MLISLTRPGYYRVNGCRSAFDTDIVISLDVGYADKESLGEALCLADSVGGEGVSNALTNRFLFDRILINVPC